MTTKPLNMGNCTELVHCEAVHPYIINTVLNPPMLPPSHDKEYENNKSFPFYSQIRYLHLFVSNIAINSKKMR